MLGLERLVLKVLANYSLKLTGFLTVCLLLNACSVSSRTDVVTKTARPVQTQTLVPTLTRVMEPTSTLKHLPPFPNATLTPTPIPKVIATVTKTRVTPSPTAYPSITPLVPAPLTEVNYGLVSWMPELANQLIDALHAYPDGLEGIDRGYHDWGYYYAYIYARFAQSEAIFRFPNSSFVEAWKWGMAYDMALFGERGVNQVYSDLITQALNTEKIGVEKLEPWLKEHEPRLRLQLIPLSPPHGYATSYLAEIADEYRATGIYSWIVGGPPYTVYPLPGCLGCDYADFGFSSASGIDFKLEDVTGDGIQEVLTEHRFFPGSGDALTTAFDVFNVSHVPFHKIEFTPPVSSRRVRTWTVLPDNGKGPGLMFKFVFDIQVCRSIEYQEEYRLEDGAFVLVDQISPDPSQIEDGEGKCMDFYVFYLQCALRSGDKYVLDDIERWIEDWPYSDMPSGISGYEKQSPDDRDGERFTIGLYLALNGERDAAIQQMNMIISSPVITASRWVDTASIFLKNYHNTSDLPKACVATGMCYQLLGVSELVEIYKKQGQAATIVDYLRSSGTPITAEGSLDVNNDGETDYWITIEENGYSYTWMIIGWGQKYRIFELGWTGEREPLNFQSLSPIQGLFVFSTNTGNDGVRYILYQNKDTLEFQIDEYYYYIRRIVRSKLDGIEQALFAGSPIDDINLDLQEMYPFIKELEQESDPSLLRDEYLIPRWYYLLSLTYELSGNREMAAKSYLTVWNRFPYSPFAILSKAKLWPVP